MQCLVRSQEFFQRLCYVLLNLSNVRLRRSEKWQSWVSVRTAICTFSTSVVRFWHCVPFIKFSFRGPLSITRNILQTEGIGGLFRGFTPTLCREIPGFFFFFGAYEFSRNQFSARGRRKDDPVVLIMSGAAGGVAIWTAIFPIDVVKSRIQIGHVSPSKDGKPQMSSTRFLPCLLQIIRNEGIFLL